MPRAKKEFSIADSEKPTITTITSANDNTKETKASKGLPKTSPKQATSATAPVIEAETKATSPTKTKVATKSNQKNPTTKASPKVKVTEPKPVTITRLELAAEVSKAVSRMMEITGKDAEAIVAEIIQSMIDSLKDGNEIEVRGFGSFRLRTRNPRRGRNPKTGESVDVPAKRVVYFKMGKSLKENFVEK